MGECIKMHTVWESKSRFTKEQGVSGLLSRLGIKKPLSKIPLVGPLLLWRHLEVNTRYKMNEIVNKFLLAENALKLNPFKIAWIYINTACRQFTKNKERIPK